MSFDGLAMGSLTRCRMDLRQRASGRQLRQMSGRTACNLVAKVRLGGFVLGLLQPCRVRYRTGARRLDSRWLDRLTLKFPPST
jgi:hypothetical protein